MTVDLTPKQKGDALELAVRAIEEQILRISPAFKEGTFVFEGQKVLRVDGVHHEIDILVTASLGPGYEAIFIFECKNWRAKVGKNEIIIFSEKVKAAKAQKGFFVALEYTQDAIRRAQTDSRVELLTATQLDPHTLDVPFGFHFLSIGATEAHIDLRVEMTTGVAETGPVDFSNTSLLVDGAERDAKAFTDEIVVEIRRERLNHFNSSAAAEGSHRVEFDGSRDFDAGRASVNGRQLKSISVRGSAEVYVSKSVIVSAFEVETRGRAISVRGALPVLGNVTATFVEVTTP